MEKDYLEEGFRTFQLKFTKNNLAEIEKKLFRPRYNNEVLLSDIKFKSPYSISLKGGKNRKVSKTAFETIRKFTGIPKSYIKLTKAETVTMNLNRRIEEISDAKKKSIILVSRNKDYSQTGIYHKESPGSG